jgi:Leucine-rich repeat (LRR) protein
MQNIERRYLVVIDDIWKEQDWKLVKSAFPENNNGSRIIATTRITGVAALCCSNSGGQPYQMAPLDDVDSRRLFFKRIFRSDYPCPAELEDISTKILKKCGGLPLAIVTFASLLANKTYNKDEWERLQDSIGTGSLVDSDGNLKVMKDILLLSYWDLPHHLKTCLLYLCIYPEDYGIVCEELKWKWMAEGFIATEWGRLDQVADNCFNELVNRNMIQPIYSAYDGSIKYCRVHDMVLDLIISLSDQEKFATVLNGRICNLFPSKIRRLSMQSSGEAHKGAVDAITETKLHVRSLTMFRPVKQIPHLVNFHALRVLDLGRCKWLENKHVKNIGSSHQLRYLRVGGNKITELPGEIGKLQHLQTLDLEGCDSLTRLPSTVVQLQKLVHLFVSQNTWLPCEFGSMQALETLEELNIWNTNSPMRFAEQLVHLTKLRKLHLNLRRKPIDDYVTRERLVSSVSELGKCNLRYLHIGGQLFERLFWDSSCTYPYLQNLASLGDIEMVPKGMASLKNLVQLSITVKEFDKEGLHLLMGMPSLTYLDLNILRVIKEKLTVGSNGFKLLKAFYFTYMTAWWHSEVEGRLQPFCTRCCASTPTARS